MRRAAALALLLFAALAAAVSPAAAWWFGPKYTAFRPERPVVVDGDPVDWPPERRDDAGDMSFAFAQGDGSLYVMFQPHTRAAKAQLAGSYGQDLALWIDPKAGMARRFGVRITAPQKTGDGRYVRVATASGEELEAAKMVEVAAGDFEAHGAVEARLPLALLGSPPPKFVTVGLETSKPLKTPPKAVDPKGRSPDELFSAVRIWVRVKLAR